MSENRRAGELAKEIAHLRGIPTEAEFRDYVADTFSDREPDDIIVEALRSKDLAPRCLAALEAIIDSINREIAANERLPPGRRKPPEWGTRMRRRRDLFGAERRGVLAIVRALEEEGSTVRRGGKPNPRRRAEHALWQLVMDKQRTVTREDASRLLDEEKEKDRLDALARKQARREERAAEKANRRTDAPTLERPPNPTGYKVG